MSGLDYLTEEEIENVKIMYPKLESSNEGENVANPEKPEDDKQEEKKQVKEDWKEGYLEFEVKNKDSKRLQYQEDEIIIEEEDGTT